MLLSWWVAIVARLSRRIVSFLLKNPVDPDVELSRVAHVDTWKEIGALIGGGGLPLKLAEKFSNGNPCFEVSLISSGKSFKRTRHVACQLEDSGFLAFASGIFLCEVFGSRIYSYSWILYTGFRVTFGLGAPSIGWEWSSGQMMEI